MSDNNECPNSLDLNETQYGKLRNAQYDEESRQGNRDACDRKHETINNVISSARQPCQITEEKQQLKHASEPKQNEPKHADTQKNMTMPVVHQIEKKPSLFQDQSPQKKQEVRYIHGNK